MQESAAPAKQSLSKNRPEQSRRFSYTRKDVDKMKHKKEKYGYGGAYIDDSLLSGIALVVSIASLIVNGIITFCH